MGFSRAHTATQELDVLVVVAQADPADNSTAMNEILRRFERLARKLGVEVARDASMQDDCANAALIDLVRAVRRHKPGTPGFPSYARISMRFAARRRAQALRDYTARHVPVDPDAGFFSALVTDNARPSASWDTERVASAVRDLRPAQQKLIERRYFEDASLGEIANEAGTSVSAVSQRLATVHRVLRESLAA
jgi:RNA polymerase sigma factor (sigma-70 family)